MALYLKGGNSLLWLGVLIISGIIIYFVFIKNGRLQQIIDQLFSGMTGTTPTSTPGGAQPPSQGTVTGTKIYPDANPPHECAETSDGGLEQGGDRKEPQIACGFDFLNTEATVYVNYHGVNDTLSVKLRGPKHGGSTPEGDMCNTIHYLALGSNSTSPFGKQWAHTGEYCDFGGSPIKLPENTWVGVKAVEWNEGNGVHMQTWIENPEGSGWNLAADYVDTGGTGCGSGAANPYTESPCSGSEPVSIGFRVDGLKGGGDVEFKNMSVREITGGGTPNTSGSTPTPTSTSTPSPTTEDEDEEEETPPTTTSPASGSCPASCEPLRNSPASYQACCNASGGAAVSNRRSRIARSMIARDFTYDAYQTRMRKKRMYSDMGSINRRMRLGNLL